MKTIIKVSRSELFSKLKLVGKITQPSKVNPTTEQFLIESSGNDLFATGTDLSGAITATINCIEISGEVRFCIDSKKMLDAISEIPEQPVSILVNKGKIEVEYFPGIFELPTYDADLFPKVKGDESTKTISVDKKILMDGIRQVINCAANDESRPALNGVFIDIKTDKLSFVATNAHTLAINEFPFETEAELSAIVPVRAAKIIIPMLSACDDVVALGISKKTISISSDKYKFQYRLTEGKYPNYRGIIPKNDLSVTVGKVELESALKRASIFANQSTLLVTLELKLNSLIIQGEDTDYSRSSKESLVVNYTNDSVKIGFNSDYLLGLISSIETVHCTLYFSSPEKAAIITPEQSGVTLLIMPLLIHS